jgi:serine/threonine protein kinase
MVCLTKKWIWRCKLCGRSNTYVHLGILKPPTNGLQPNIVKYIEHIDWEEYLYIIMEYIPGGDLGSLINRNGPLSELEVKMMATQLLSALGYLHEKGITHRDVKPDNILIYNRNQLVVKLTDFGLSKMVDSEETFLRTFCGTLLYCAPEVYSEYREYDSTGQRNLRGIDRRLLPPQRYGHAVDIWSLAGVLFYSFCGSPPYPAKHGITYQELLNHIMSQPLDVRPLQMANVSDQGIRFVRSMLHINPAYRADIHALERNAWLTGEPSMSISIDSMDEVDMISTYVDPQLEEGTSQLSIQKPNEREIGNSEGNMSDLTELQQPEIPSSFNTSDNSVANESYGFMQQPLHNAGNGRLFGEVDPSALGSSGAVPLDLPRPEVNMNTNFPSHSFSRPSLYDPNEFLYDSREESNSQHLDPSVASHMSPPQVRSLQAPEINLCQPLDMDEPAVRSSSLMGAESMVGNLNMHSPSEAVSPGGIPTEVATEVSDVGVSLRRRREESYDSDESWRPAGLPMKKRRKSAREIDLPVPKAVFWNPKDKSTHHNNYPNMSLNDFKAYQEYAETKGERFAHGEDTFDRTMRSFRTSRSPSLEPEAMARAHSEPTKDEGRRMLMKRDERKLDAGPMKLTEPRPLLSKDTAMPSTARGSHEPDTNTFANGSPTNIPRSTTQPVVGNDFQPPKRILGKIISTSDSCLPTITLNITDIVTSWGRGFKNTIRYSNGQDIRVPKYAFKIFLFKPSFYKSDGSLPNNVIPGNGKNSSDQDMLFYISTKASQGITVNGVKLSSYDPQNPYTPSRSWGELRYGDIITVWQHNADKNQQTRFRFECYWGNSKDPRTETDRFHILPDSALLSDIEHVCLAQEMEMLDEIERRDEEEKLALAQDKKDEQARRAANVTQSFMGAPASAST